MPTTPKHKHDHVECEHDIAYCKTCDECYCKKCNKCWPQIKIVEKPVNNVVTWPKPSVRYNNDDIIEAISRHIHSQP